MTLKEGYSIEKMIRPERKVILKRAYTAKDYWTHGQEVGFQHWGRLKQVQGSLYGEPMGMWFAEKYRPAGTSEYVMGIEVPIAYDEAVPDDMEIVTLSACTYLLFKGPQFTEGSLREASEQLQNVIDGSRIEDMGLEWFLDSEQPIIEYDPLPGRGCIFAYPVTAKAR